MLNMTKLIALVMLTPVYPLGVLRCSDDPRSPQAAGPSELKTVREQAQPYIDWFPENTETLLVVRRPYKIPDEYVRKAAARPAYATLQESLIRAVFEGTSRKLVAGRTIVLWVEALRNFHAPKVDLEIPIAPIVYEGCNVIVFEKPVDTAEFTKRLVRYVRRYERRDGKKYARETEIAGHAVLEYLPRQLQQGPLGYSYWLTFLDARTLVVATSSSFLKTTLKQDVVNDGPFPEELAAWRHIGSGSSVWGIRKFSGPPKVSDPTDPRHEWGDDPKARCSGIVFDLDSKPGESHVVFWGIDELMQKRAKYACDRINDAPIFQETRPGVLSIRFLWFEDARKVQGRVFSWLKRLLGHAAIV